MDIYQKALSGEIYDPFDQKLMDEQLKHLEQVRKFNQTKCSKSGLKKREKMLKKMFAEIGNNCYIEPPLHANFGGKNVHFGNNVYCNYNLTLVDDSEIFVGDYTMFAPNVVIATATHPVLPELRLKGLQYNLPIHIGKNCWLGAGVIVLPGITIGDNSVIGASSVVTKDIPANVVAVGNPCKVLREIGQKDRQFYHKDMQIPKKWLEK